MSEHRDNDKPELFFWTAMVLAAFLILPPFGAVTPTARENIAVALNATQVSEENAGAPGAAVLDPFQNLPLSAKAAIVYDTTAGAALYERNADEVRPLASLAKLVTAATALSLIPATTEVVITAQAIVQEGDSGFRAGEKWLLRDLISLMLLESSNDAAFAIAAGAGAVGAGTESEAAGHAYFIDRMNLRAREMGLLQTYFLNATGLDLTPRLGGAYGSARELALILEHELSAFPEAFTATRSKELTVENGHAEPRAVKNTNRDTDRFPLLIASKTGYTDLAGGNLALAFDAGLNRPVIVVVLGSTREGRFEDAEKLVWGTLNYLQAAD